MDDTLNCIAKQVAKDGMFERKNCMSKAVLKEKNVDSVVIKVEGRVDSTNSSDIQAEILAILEENPCDHLVFDFEEVDYISSAGLRVINTLQKRRKDKIKVINVSSAVFEIFQDTGFDSILEVERQLRKVSVEGCKMIGKGANGEVYRLDLDSIIKVYPKNALIEDVKRERNLAQKAFLQGIPTAISYNVVDCDGKYGIIFELLNSDCLSSVISKYPENYDKYATEYVGLYKKMHNTVAQDGAFPSIKDIYYSYIEGCKDWYSPEEIDILIQLVDNVPDRNTLIHGDYHAHNIMIQDDELTLIDMGDLSYGHPIFDFLATASTQANLVELNPEFAQVHTGMPVEYIKKLWNDLLRMYFVDKSEDEIKKIDQQIRLYSKLKVAMAPVVAKGIPIELMKASVEDAKENLIKKADELMGKIDW